jgi:hypothetical protein
MGFDPVVEDPLNIQSPLQSLSGLGIEVLTPTIRTATPSQGGIMSLIMIGMHLSLWANRSVRML